MSHNEILESGLLELFAMGSLDGDEFTIVSEAVLSDPILAQELAQIEEALLVLAQLGAVEPNPTIKPLLLAKIDYSERLKKGEVPAHLPILTSGSQIQEFEKWLLRQDMQIRPDFNEAQVSIISDEPDKMTAIVWLKSGAPPETHNAEYEKFLIVEGTCDITIGTAVHSLKRGDYLSIPLHVTHHVRVTSEVPCKIILQRVKAVLPA